MNHKTEMINQEAAVDAILLVMLAMAIALLSLLDPSTYY